MIRRHELVLVFVFVKRVDSWDCYVNQHYNHTPWIETKKWYVYIQILELRGSNRGHSYLAHIIQEISSDLSKFPRADPQNGIMPREKYPWLWGVVLAPPTPHPYLPLLKLPSKIFLPFVCQAYLSIFSGKTSPKLSRGRGAWSWTYVPECISEARMGNRNGP